MGRGGERGIGGRGFMEEGPSLYFTIPSIRFIDDILNDFFP